jgi:small GTP-binding protein
MSLRSSASITRTPSLHEPVVQPPRVIVIGAMGVGKTDLLYTATIHDPTNIYSLKHLHETTIVVDYFPTTRKLAGGKTMKLAFFDTAGQEKFRSVVKTYYRGAVAVILMFDVTDSGSFHELKNCWYPEAWEEYKTLKQKPLFFLVGTKTDLLDKREVDTDDARFYAETIDAMYFETNTRQDGGNVARITIDCIAAAMAKQGVPTDVERSVQTALNNDIIILRESQTLKNKKKCSC